MRPALTAVFVILPPAFCLSDAHLLACSQRPNDGSLTFCRQSLVVQENLHSCDRGYAMIRNGSLGVRWVTRLSFGAMVISVLGSTGHTEPIWERKPSEIIKPSKSLPTPAEMKRELEKKTDEARQIVDETNANLKRASDIHANAQTALDNIEAVGKKLGNDFGKLSGAEGEKIMQAISDGEKALQANVESQFGFAAEVTKKAIAQVRMLGGQLSSIIDDLLHQLVGVPLNSLGMIVSKILVVVIATVAFFLIVWIVSAFFRMLGGGSMFGKVLIVAGIASIVLGMYPIGASLIGISVLAFVLSRKRAKVAVA